MKDCAWREDVVQAVRGGQWPQGCGVELREHVAMCARCGEEANLLTAFAVARAGAMRVASQQSAQLLWWKAQLRRRHDAMTRVQRPGVAIFTASVVASVLLLAVALVVSWRTVEWSRLAAMFSSVERNPWILFPVGAVACGFAVVALVVGLGAAEERG